MSGIELQKRRTVVSPWKNVAEFEKVYQWVFGEKTDEKQQRRALSQMYIWSLRRSTLCPAAVLATSTLIEVRLRDTTGGNREMLTLGELQTLYASALTRFFNFMSSTMQTHNMRTMYDTAQQLGLPWFVVDLRHLCAHGQVLPPLDLLRTTVVTCLNWLRDYYWNTQRSIMKDVDASGIRRKDKTEFGENVANMFEIYDSALECYCKGAHNIKTGKRFLHGKRFTHLKAYYTEHQFTLLKDVFDCVIDDLAKLVKRDIAIKDMSEIFIEALLRMKYFFTVSDTHSTGENLVKLIKITRNFFRMLAMNGFIEELFYNLMDLAENSLVNDARRKSAGFWALQIVRGFVAFRKCKKRYKAELDVNPDSTEFDFSLLNMETLTKIMRKQLIYAGVDLNDTLIFGDSLRRPWIWVFDRSFLEEHLYNINEHTAPVLREMLILIEPALTLTEERGVVALINAIYKDESFVEQAAEPLKSIEQSDGAIHTASELLKLLKQCSTEDMEIDENELPPTDKKYGLWEEVEDDELNNWSTCPLGRLPWE